MLRQVWRVRIRHLSLLCWSSHSSSNTKRFVLMVFVFARDIDGAFRFFHIFVRSMVMLAKLYCRIWSEARQLFSHPMIKRWKDRRRRRHRARARTRLLAMPMLNYLPRRTNPNDVRDWRSKHQRFAFISSCLSLQFTLVMFCCFPFFVLSLQILVQVTGWLLYARAELTKVDSNRLSRASSWVNDKTSNAQHWKKEQIKHLKLSEIHRNEEKMNWRMKQCQGDRDFSLRRKMKTIDWCEIVMDLNDQQRLERSIDRSIEKDLLSCGGPSLDTGDDGSDSLITIEWIRD